MKKFSKNLMGIVLAIALVLGFTPPIPAHAATSPSLGAADSFSVIAQTGITGIATIIGNVGMNSAATWITNLMQANVTGGGMYSFNAGLTANSETTSQLDTAVQANLSTAYDNLDSAVYNNSSASCLKASTSGSTTGTDTGVIELGGKSLAPGVYCTDGSFEITGQLTLVGTTGTWVFKSATGLTTMTDSSVIGGDPCNVWWRIGTAAAGLGTNSTFIGTIIASTGITFGTGVTLNGRALALGANVTLNSGGTISGPTCSAPAATLTLVKTISGGTRPVADFPLTASGGATPITGVSGTAGVTSQTVDPGTYTLSETTQSDYTAGTWSCTNGITVNGSSQITLGSDDTTTCTITNTYIQPASGSSSGSTPIYGCKDTTATNYNAFSTSNPALCTYANIPVVTPLVVAPLLPKTGFPPQEKSNLWNIVIGAGVLILVSASFVLALKKSKI